MPRPPRAAPARAPRPLVAAIAVLLVAGLLGAAGVGIADDPDPPAGVAAAPVAPVVADALVFQDDDFPAGWRRGARDDVVGSPGAGGSGAGAEFCPSLGGDPTAGRLVSEAESFFTSDRDGSFSFAGAFVGVADDAGLAPEAFSFLAGETFLRCAADGFAMGFLEAGTEGVTLTEDAQAPIPVAPGTGQVEGRRLTYTARGPDFSVPLVVDLAVVQAGASVALTFLGSYRQPLDPELEKRLLDRLADRMAATG